jgi:hypothetical protein
MSRGTLDKVWGGFNESTPRLQFLAKIYVLYMQVYAFVPIPKAHCLRKLHKRLS